MISENVLQNKAIEQNYQINTGSYFAFDAGICSRCFSDLRKGTHTEYCIYHEITAVNESFRVNSAALSFDPIIL